MLSRALLVLTTCVSIPAMAQWSLDSDNSALHFLSTKNAQVTEIHEFEMLKGTVSDSGKLTVDVALDSVNTSIAIRDTRIKEKLFNVGMYPQATFTADIPADMMALETGETAQGTVTGTMDLHGMTAPVSFSVMVSKVSDDLMSVSTLAPTLIKAEDFGLKAGIDTLQSIAGLSSITYVVPVSFSVTFEK